MESAIIKEFLPLNIKDRSCLRSPDYGRSAWSRKWAGLLFLLGLTVSAATVAQPGHQQDDDRWAGVWNAEDTLFTLRVIRTPKGFTVEPVESMGLVWTAGNGVINGDSATIDVEYQGVTGRVMVQLIGKRTAVARALSCQPDYHVICALVRNQQAKFLKQSPSG